MKEIEAKDTSNVILIGAGIMSATLGVMLKVLNPNLTIQIFERLDTVAGESSDAWNNAGTGHSALCELNYTPEKADGTIDCTKAIAIDEQFEVSRQFWAWLVEQKIIDPGFIHSIPHMSFVWGDKNVSYLRKRHAALTQFYPFSKMKYSEDKKQLAEWMPIVMQDRNAADIVAATRMEIGTDVNFGALTRALLNYLDAQPGVTIYLNHEVRRINKQDDASWDLKVKNLKSGDKRYVKAGFVFIGAGGGSLPLLAKSDIPEGKGFGGFPLSGQWLRCTNEDVIEKHHAKVYGKAAVGAPPMSVPHLDTRIINGKKALLFGPYAGFSTKFLKHGSYMDLPLSINFQNIMPMISAGLDNIPLTKYLIHEVRQSGADRMNALREFLPDAKEEDWVLEVAGQRVQIIKKDEKEGGILEFGTEVVTAADGSLAALLGASPGASTSVSIMLGLLKISFKDDYIKQNWEEKLKQMIPSYGRVLVNNPKLCDEVRKWTSNVLELVNE